MLKNNPLRAASGEGHRSRPGLALVLICAVQLMVILDGTIVNVALPSIQRALNFSASGLEWVVAAYALTFGGFLLLGGRSGDLYGRRRMFVTGVAVFTAASLLGGLAPTSGWLIAARMLQGIGGAIASPTALALIQNTFAEGPERARAMGVYAVMSAAGGSIGLLLGGMLTDLVSWRWVFFVNVPLGLVVATAAPCILPAGDTRSGRLDVAGAVAVTAGMTSLVYGFTRAASSGWSDALTVASLAGGVGLLGLFIRLEATRPHALMPLRIFAERTRSGAYLIMLCLASGMFGAFFFMSQYVQDVLGYSPMKAGLAFLPMTVGIGVAANVLARTVGRVGTRRPMVVGPLLGAAGLFWLSFAGVGAGYGSIVGPVVLIAVGMGCTFLPLTLTVMSRVAPGDAGLASALLNSAQQIGGSLGLSIVVTIVTAVTAARRVALAGAGHVGAALTPASAHAVAHQALTAGYDFGFRAASLIALGGFVVALLLAGGRPTDGVTAADDELGVELDYAA
ncbi:MAG TPA: MFS transporter [Acidimicrobiales bacterium]|nr:MFS transporter [Acidimicrobiales bacterium]